LEHEQVARSLSCRLFSKVTVRHPAATTIGTVFIEPESTAAHR
jgi:hypothetical protein